MFQTKIVEKLKHTFDGPPSLKNHGVCEIMWKSVVEPDRPQMTI